MSKRITIEFMRTVPVCLVALSVLMLIGIHPIVLEWLSFDALRYHQGDWWRPWTAWLVQLNIRHWLLNQGGLILMFVVLPKRLPSKALLGYVWVWLFCSVALSLSDYDNYVGLSGVLYGWLLWSLYLSRHYGYIVKVIVFSLISVKVLIENGGLPWFSTQSPLKVDHFIQAQIAYQSHLWGVIAGWVAVFFMWVRGIVAQSRS